MVQHTINVRSAVHSTDARQRERPTRTSLFFVTINPNQRYPERTEAWLEAKQEFIAIVRKLFGPQWSMRLLMKPGGAPVLASDIKNIDVDAVVETSPERDLLHAHVRVLVKHTTRVHINLQLLRHVLTVMFQESTKLPLHEDACPHVWVNAMSTEQDLETYMSKHARNSSSSFVSVFPDGSA